MSQELLKQAFDQGFKAGEALTNRDTGLMHHCIDYFNRWKRMQSIDVKDLQLQFDLGWRKGRNIC